MHIDQVGQGGLVSIIVVNWNGADDLPSCLEAVRGQDYRAVQCIVVDNASTDGSREYLSRQQDLQLIRNPLNRGFAPALNQAIRESRGEFVLSLNPDVTMEPNFVRLLVERLQAEPSLGLATGKLLQARSERAPILDSTGLFVDRRRRTYDRGQDELDRGQYDDLPYAFGACGAAALYRRAALEDLAIAGEIWDELFFAYYEDADLAWRAQLFGWSCAYVPQARAYHVRGRGDALCKPGHAPKDSINLARSWRNRYLMTLKNDAAPHFWLDLPRILLSELPRLAYMALFVPRALRGIVGLAQAWRVARDKRRVVQERRRVPPSAVRRWFTHPQQAARGEV